MSALDGLAAVFGSAFGALFADGVLHKTTSHDTGGGFSVTTADLPVKALIETSAVADRVPSGIPAGAVLVTVLRAGLPVTVDLDDAVTLGGTTYRVVKVDTDPVGASYSLATVVV